MTAFFIIQYWPLELYKTQEPFPEVKSSLRMKHVFEAISTLFYFQTRINSFSLIEKYLTSEEYEILFDRSILSIRCSVRLSVSQMKLQIITVTVFKR